MGPGSMTHRGNFNKPGQNSRQHFWRKYHRQQTGEDVTVPGGSSGNLASSSDKKEVTTTK